MTKLNKTLKFWDKAIDSAKDGLNECSKVKIAINVFLYGSIVFFIIVLLLLFFL